MSPAPDLFQAAGVDVPHPESDPVFIRRRAARNLVRRIEALTLNTQSSFPTAARATARRAELLGAHALARAIRWYAHPEAVGRHGYDAMTIYLERRAREWLARQEAMSA